MAQSKDAALAQLRRGVLEYCVMALVEDDERYGFEIVSLLSKHEGLVTTEGTIYPLLARLKRDKLVETVWRESTSGPPRKYYKLTAGGRKSLELFKQEWSQFSGAVEGLIGRKDA